MGSYGGDAKGDGGVPTSGGPEDSRDVISDSWVVGMGEFIGIIGIGGGGAVVYEEIHSEEVG